MKRKALWLMLAGMMLGLGLSQAPAWAQEKVFPSKQVTYLVCFDPGGQSDRGARVYQAPLSAALGQKVIIDYKVGGGGALGWRELTRTKPDGYTFAGFNIPHIILQPMQQDVGYRTEQIVPIMVFQRTPLALAVLGTSPIKTLPEFIEHAKKNPGTVTIGGSGAYSGYHMAVLRFEKLTGTKITYVPFTGSAPQMTAFLGGHVNAVFGASDDLTRFRDQVRVLGFAMEERFPGFPDAPTLKEQGLDMMEAVDRGVAVPPNTPLPIIKKLEEALIKVANLPEVREEMIRQGFIPMAMGHEETKAHIVKMTAIYKELTANLAK
ncbi:MAG: tripartite tricarboxylate transporter substrate binding protein [Desulfarculus sp.]|nr:tripartite tricarboxylate transporter substrate binding protein [Desulfarculus sp.]